MFVCEPKQNTTGSAQGLYNTVVYTNLLKTSFWKKENKVGTRKIQPLDVVYSRSLKWRQETAVKAFLCRPGPPLRLRIQHLFLVKPGF